ncbi:hypothetical protein HK105_200735 [Polyrhizophydium stewartii]|uniref:Uncharacterized protein n=1 Tax=Polyrhizophydium stewartii TaxID=2732419 RepID=A0ABR4NJW8_9FUNG
MQGAMNRQRGHLGTKAAVGFIKRLKILSMGDPGVGKSCLIKRYCEGRFVPEYVTTIGIDFGVKTVKYETDEFKVNFWDVGGDPIYFDIRNEFYKDTHGTMLVVDVSSRRSFESIERWMTELRSYANTNVVMFLVANKIDVQPRVVSTTECESVAHKIGAKYFETSAVTGEGVADMFDRLFLSAAAIHRALSWTLWFLLVLPSPSLELANSFQPGAVSSVPASGSNAELNALFNLSTQTSGLSKGDGQIMFMRWFTWDGDRSTSPSTYTAAFWVVVDDYSQLVVPNSVSLLVPAASTASAYRNVSLFYYQTVNNRAKVICNLKPRRMWIKTDFDWAVSGRTVLLNLDGGQVSSCDWAPTNCVGSPNSYALDDICADSCTGQTCGYNITLRVAWTGTDARGSRLTSYSRDIWRLQNSLQS